MKFYIIGVSILLLRTIPLSGQAAASTAQLVSILKKSDIGTNAVKYTIEIGKTFSGNTQQLKNEIAQIHPDLSQYNADFSKRIAAVKSLADRDKIIFKSVEFGNSVILSPVYAIPVLGGMMKEMNGQIFDAAEKDLNRNYQKKLAYSLEELRKKNQAKYDAVIQSKDYGEVKKALDEVNFFSNQGYKDLAPEFQEVIEKSQQRFLQDNVNLTLKRLLDDVGDQQIDIQKVTANIDSLSKFTYKFAEESNQRFEKLYHSQKQLNDKVDAFYGEYRQDKQALGFMQDFMYSKMNTEEKINALQSGLFPDISNDAKRKLTAELEIIKKREDVFNAAQDFLNSASISLKIASDLGLGDSPFAKDVSAAVQYGQAAFGAVTNFMSGNYLQAISSVTGLFGGRGPDIAEQRHRQIMERFDRIDKSLEKIDKKLEILIEGQQKIIENQQKTFEFLVGLADNINQQHNEVMNEFRTVENALYVNRQLIKNQWEVECQSCMEIIKKRLALNVDDDIFPGYKLLRQEYANIRPAILPACESYILRYRFASDGSKINPDFYLESFINGLNNAQQITDLRSVNDKGFQLLFNSDPFRKSEESKKKLITALFFPAGNVSELENKYSSDTLKLSDANYKFELPYFLNLLQPQVIERHGYVIRNMGFVIGLTDEKRNLVNWNTLAMKDMTLRNLRLELNEAIQLNNISIAQQALLSGDILLPVLYDILEVKKNNAQQIAVSKELLAKNATLAANFVNYYFHRRTGDSTLNQAQYSFLYNTKDSSLFSRNIRPVYPVEYIDSSDVRIKNYHLTPGWHMIIDALPYNIPGPLALNNIPLIQTASLSILTDNRNKLYKQLKSYEIYNGLSANEIRDLNYMILKTQN